MRFDALLACAVHCAYPALTQYWESAHMRRSLNKRLVDKLEPEGADYVVWDEGLRGFGVRVKPSGVKSFVVQYRSRTDGTSRRKTLGQHGPLLSFHEARERARLLLADALRGVDPVGTARAARTAPTMRELATAYLNHHAIPKKRPKSVENDRSIIERHIMPYVGDKKVTNVRRRDVEELHV